MLKQTGVSLVLAILLVFLGGLPVPNENFQANAASSSEASDSSHSPVTETPASENNESLEQDAQNTLELALKTINLSQGEGGLEVWRLKANWANMQKENGTIVVREPNLTYFMPEKGKTLFVTSETGVINQKEQMLSFIKRVRISQEDKLLLGDLLVYNGTAKTMTFPNGGQFTGTGISGSASRIIWNINQRMIEAEGEVSVRFAGAESSSLSSSEQGN